LPEVEIFKRYLDATSLHQRIDDVDVRNTYVLKETSARELARGLKGRRFESSRRHGKHLFVRADGELWLRLHFGMTGSLQYFKNDEQAPRHARVLFVFANNHRLAFDDQRQFGQIGLLKDVDEFLKERELGPDALDLGLGEFRKILEKHRGAVKSVLLNQRIIAGIGNIYADEILFRVRIHPATEIARLNDAALTKLFRAGHTTFWKERSRPGLARTKFQDLGCCRGGKVGNVLVAGNLNQRPSADAPRGFVRIVSQRTSRS
jgi:formamidopyrimidine-DNA glycosylase